MRYSPVYEFHDINSENYADIAKILDKSKQWHLMIIPGNIPKEQLEKWKSLGYKLYIHGFRHKADLSLKRSLWGRLILKITNNEAEFAGLSKEDKKMLLEKAYNAWNALGVGEADGFVAPAWYGIGSRFSTPFKSNKFSIPFSVAGLPKFMIPIVNFSQKIYLRLFKIFNFLPIPRIVEHPC